MGNNWFGHAAWCRTCAEVQQELKPEVVYWARVP